MRDCLKSSHEETKTGRSTKKQKEEILSLRELSRLRFFVAI